MSREWMVIEIRDGQAGGIRVHDANDAVYIISGNPQWAYQWRRTNPRWAIPSLDLDPTYPWPFVHDGDVSANGELALARRTTRSGRLQVFDIRDGQLIFERDVCPLAVGWSVDGRLLAVLQWSNVGDSAMRVGRVGPKWLDDVRLCLYDRSGRLFNEWNLKLQPSAKSDYWWNNRFVVNWSNDDSLLLVSTKKAIRNGMIAKTYLIDPDVGPIDSADVSDAFFLGNSRFVANEHGKWTAACFFDGAAGTIQRLRPVGRRLFPAGSSPEEGVFLAYVPPSSFPMLRFALRVILVDREGNPTARDTTGYSYGSSVRMVRSDAPLAEALRTLVSAAEGPRLKTR